MPVCLLGMGRGSGTVKHAAPWGGSRESPPLPSRTAALLPVRAQNNGARMLQAHVEARYERMKQEACGGREESLWWC